MFTMDERKLKQHRGRIGQRLSVTPNPLVTGRNEILMADAPVISNPSSVNLFPNRIS